MTQPNVFVTRRIPDQGLAMIRQACAVTLWEDELPPPYNVLRAEAARADGLLTLLSDRVDAPLLESAPRLKVVTI